MTDKEQMTARNDRSTVYVRTNDKQINDTHNTVDRLNNRPNK